MLYLVSNCVKGDMELDVDSPQQQQTLLLSDYDVEVAMEGDGEKKIYNFFFINAIRFTCWEGRRLLEGLERQNSEVCGSAGGGGSTGRGGVLRRVVELGLLEETETAGEDRMCWRGREC